MAKYNQIRHIVRIRQMLHAWRSKASAAAAARRLPPDVPAGHVAICVGSSCRRFVVHTTHLNHPIFRRLLSQVEEEYGISSRPGPLAIPCDVSHFEEILRVVTLGDSFNSEIQKCCHVGIGNENADYLGESRPLLYGSAAR